MDNIFSPFAIVFRHSMSADSICFIMALKYLCECGKKYWRLTFIGAKIKNGHGHEL
jgi:hypothetical protein